jgi:hypothetical protein
VEMAALLLGLCALAACGLLRIPAMRAGSPLTPAVAWGIGLGIFAPAAVSMSSACNMIMAGAERPALIYRSAVMGCSIAFSVLAAALGWLWNRRTQRARRLGLLAASLFAAAAVFCGLLMLTLAETRSTLTLLQEALRYPVAISSIGGWVAYIECAGTGILIAVSAVPCLIAMAAAIAARIKRRPAAVTILLSWRAALPWIVCALVAAYAVLAVPAAKLNDRLCTLAYKQAENAPQAMARFEGASWPVR